MRRVAVISALAVETEILRGRNEKRFEQIAVGLLVQLDRHVQDATGDGHRPSEAQQPEKSENVR